MTIFFPIRLFNAYFNKAKWFKNRLNDSHYFSCYGTYHADTFNCSVGRIGCSIKPIEVPRLWISSQNTCIYIYIYIYIWLYQRCLLIKTSFLKETFCCCTLFSWLIDIFATSFVVFRDGLHATILQVSTISSELCRAIDSSCDEFMIFLLGQATTVSPTLSYQTIRKHDGNENNRNYYI